MGIGGGEYKSSEAGTRTVAHTHTHTHTQHLSQGAQKECDDIHNNE